MKAQGDSQQEEEHRYRIDDDTWCLIIAASQVLGGAGGIIMCVYHFGLEPPNLVVSLLVAPFVWGVYAGVLLWRGKRTGLEHSMALQVMQIVLFAVPLIGYELAVGPALQIGWLGNGLVLSGHFGGYAAFHLDAESAEFRWGINLIALAAFLYLRKIKARLIMAESIAL